MSNLSDIQNRAPLVDYQDESDAASPQSQNYEEFHNSGDEDQIMEEAQSDAETASVSSHSQASNHTVDSKKSNQSWTTARSSAITPGSIFSEYANLKAMMENIIHHYKVELERLIKQYNCVLSSASPEILK
ncbi:hypothetical protein BDA99DRAFT_565625 [Phascolomyces articulosus]|uniref:Uncharacterized protein n=1 Tax=Phascolomyces articulosus TaxID=60185 RepID=A0AAD5JNQ0_9FUNG|nr:hypothetical protein BDA99DRAFT_565625 [Phascolomyces articulosus]